MSPSNLIEDSTQQGQSLDIGGLVRRYILFALLATLLGTAGGVVAVAFFPPRYKARTLVEVQPLTSGVLRPTGIENDSNQVDLLTEAQIILSNTFLRQVVESLRWDSPPQAPADSGIFATLRKRLKIDSSDATSVLIGRDGLDVPPVSKPLAMSISTVEAQPIFGTRILEITCESTNPEVASTFLNALVDQYIQQNLMSRMQTVQLTTQWLSQQLEESKNKMLQADERLQAFSQKSGNVLAGPQEGTLAEAQVRELQARLSSAQADVLFKQIRYDAVKKTPPTSVPEVLDDPEVRTYQSKVADLQREKSTLLVTVTPENPKIKRLDLQLSDAEASLRKATDSVVRRITNDYETAVRTRDALNKAYSSQLSRVSAQAGDVASFNALKRESDSAHKMYENLLLQSNQASIAGSIPINNIRITERSVPPQVPYKPKPPVIIGIGAAAGLGLCLGIAFLRERFDPKLKSPQHAREFLNLPQLGIIPSVEEKKTRRRLLGGPGTGRERPSDSVEIIPLVANDAAAPSLDGSRVKPLLAESFRLTLASLMRESGGRPQVIMVTSPGPEEGKTTIAANLGVALAETGRRVLVFDGDFRRPRAHKMFGIAQTRGVVDLLSEKTPVGDYPKETLGIPTEFPQLFVLPNGREAENITTALYSLRLREVINRLRKEFDTIVIDAPPLLGIADAQILSALADGVVLILRAGVSDKKSAAEALDQLRIHGTVVLGTVLNDWKAPKSQLKRNYYYAERGSYDRS